MEQAVARRLGEELGLWQVKTRFHFKFRYTALYGTVGSENELCSVFSGITDQAPQHNRHEIESMRWVSPRRWMTR
ncbi:MAG: NUDIX domain-containing protein [Pseudomonadota bacterium]